MLIGIVTAFFGSLVGLGGGVILVPTLLFLHKSYNTFEWASPQVIVGISLVTMVFTALSSTISYFRKGRVDYRIGFLFLTGSIPGGVFGSWLNQFINMDLFSIYFGFVMIFLALLLFIKRQPRNNPVQGKTMRVFHVGGQTYQYHISIWQSFIISLFVGVLSGLFGIGGGAIMVPTMILLFGFPAHIAAATSMFMIFFVSIINASTHIALGHIAWEYALFFIPGAIIGGILGAKVNQMVNGEVLKWMLRLLLILVGIRLIFEGLL